MTRQVVVVGAMCAGRREQAARPAGVDAAALATVADVTDAALVEGGLRVRLSDESALAIAGTRRFVAAGSIKDPDAPRLEEAMRAAYARMRLEEDGELLVPVTIRNADVIALRRPRAPVGAHMTAVVFLHGWGGRWALPCWQVARALVDENVTTACPDAGLAGEWWSRDAEAIVRKTVEALRAVGHDRFVLVGLSNGAAGAARLATRITETFTALALISGADPLVAPAPIPTLVIHGKRDSMSGIDGARQYAKRAHATVVTLESGHFAMLLEAERAEGAIHDLVANLAPP